MAGHFPQGAREKPGPEGGQRSLIQTCPSPGTQSLHEGSHQRAGWRSGGGLTPPSHLWLPGRYPRGGSGHQKNKVGGLPVEVNYPHHPLEQQALAADSHLSKAELSEGCLSLRGKAVCPHCQSVRQANKAAPHSVQGPELW